MIYIYIKSIKIPENICDINMRFALTPHIHRSAYRCLFKLRRNVRSPSSQGISWATGLAYTRHLWGYRRIPFPWWCNNHLEKYEFNGKDDIPYMKWKIT